MIVTDLLRVVHEIAWPCRAVGARRPPRALREVPSSLIDDMRRRFSFQLDSGLRDYTTYAGFCNDFRS
jgi:hypothetical protein